MAKSIRTTTAPALMVLGVLACSAMARLGESTSRDGHVNRTQFPEAMTGHGVDITPGEALRSFGNHDSDLDGKLTPEELQRAVSAEHARTFQRRVERYLWPLGLMSCPLMWLNAAYFAVKIIVFDDISSITLVAAALSASSAVLLQFSFLYGWNVIVDLAGGVTLVYILLVLPVFVCQKCLLKTGKMD